MTELVVNVKQGEAKNIQMTVYSGNTTTPLDLTGATITVEVKTYPNISTDSLFTKIITESSDELINGKIIDATNGVFNIRFNEDNTSLDEMDYYIIIFVEQNNSTFIISSSNCENSIYRVCTQ